MQVPHAEEAGKDGQEERCVGRWVAKMKLP